MKFGGALFLVTLCAGAASAHRLDEYLQATLIGISREGVEVEIVLTPGVAVYHSVAAVLDRNGDGRISSDEETAYGKWVAEDLELRIDGRMRALRVVEKRFSSLEEMHEGLGSIRLKLHADWNGHTIRFTNRHLPELSAYLVNCLASPGDGLTVGPQVRDEGQRSIEFDYAFAPSGTRSGPWRRRGTLMAAAAGMLGLTCLVTFVVQKWRRFLF